MNESASKREQVERLAEEFAERYRNGERPAVGDYVAAYPEYAAEIQELFPALVVLEELAPSDDGSAAAAHPARGAGAVPPQRIGDYRILREIGRGGMGVVYEAEQESLGRRVALKVLPVQAAGDARLLERFRRESRAAARLHHTNIVPVFEVGQDGGLCYYAMQFIQGQALDEVLRELQRLRAASTTPLDPTAAGPVAHSLWTGQFEAPAASADGEPRPAAAPTEPPAPTVDAPASLPGHSDLSAVESNYRLYCRNAARIGQQVAEALAYAHARGVVHRDIKPSNLLLDTAGVVWVTDFGLAKTDDAGLTQTGDLVGTLRYMAPERFQGACDAGADVYALGLTLYELLVLRPAFTAADRLRLMERIARQEPPRPRALDPRIPRDLETVVLKAMDKDPRRRYPSAEALADDLRHFLADEPIRARRQGLLARLWRRLRRNPAIATLSGAVAVLLVVTLAGLVVNSLVRQERDRAVRAEQRALGAERENKIREHLARAAAHRHSGRVGQRFGSLGELSAALALEPSPELRRAIRDEAAAALVLPDVEVAREWEGWPEDTLAVAFDAAFDRYARMNRQGELTVCRLAPGGEEVLARLPAYGRPLFHGPWLSPDGRFLAYGHSCEGEAVPGRLRVWKLDGPEPAVLLDDPAGVREWALAFHPDGRRLAVRHDDGTVSVYDLATGQPSRRLELGGPADNLAFHPRDGRLAAACGNAVRLFDVDTGRELPPLRHPDKVTWTAGLAWHPDGRHLATGCNDLKIHFWDVDAAAEVMPPWEGHHGNGIYLTFNHAGDRLASTDWLGQQRLWDAATGRLLLTVPGGILLQFSPDDRLIGYGHDGSKLRLWRVAGGRELCVYRPPGLEATEEVVHSSVHPDGRVAAASLNRRLSFFDLDNGKELAAVPLPADKAAVLGGFDPSGGWLTAGSAGLLLWPARVDPARPGGLRVGPPRQLAPPSTFERMGASRDGRVLAVPGGDHALVLDRERPGRQVVLQPVYDVRSCAVSPDGRWVVTCGFWWDGRTRSVHVWDADSGRHVQELPLEGKTWASFSPDGRWLATMGGVPGCRLWEVDGWRAGPGFDWLGGLPVFSPDGKLLALADVAGAISLREPDTGREVCRLTGPGQVGYAPACFSPDGTRLIATTADQQALYVWDLRLLRQQLKELGLDWDWPEFTPPQPGGPRPSPAVEVDPGILREPLLPDDRLTVAVLSASLALQPVNPEAYFQRGLAYGRLKDAQRAIADYSMFLTLAPPDDGRRVEALIRRATNCWMRGDYAGMLGALRGLLAVPADQMPWPGHFALLCDYAAWHYVEAPPHEGFPKEALALAEKMVEIEPYNANYQTTLGAARYRAGKFPEAVACLERSLEMGPEWPGFDLYVLAMSYQRLGQGARARECFDRANAWRDAHQALSPQHTAELTALRAEAEALLNGK
jgi:serine/threonine protein kinase/WD40 repeat protein